jgi:hypothetical protein
LSRPPPESAPGMGVRNRPEWVSGIDRNPHFRRAADRGLAALFSEAVGPGFVSFLETVGVASVWHEGGAWLGSTNALAAGLAG